MRNVSRQLLIRDQLQTILRGWKIDTLIPVRGDFKIDLNFPGQYLNRGKVRKTKKKSVYGKPLYELIIFKGELCQNLPSQNTIVMNPMA